LIAADFHLPHAAIGARVARIETHGQGKWVEPQYAARPGGCSASSELTPHGFSLPAGIMFPVDGAMMSRCTP
jgi:hypothetical protein